MTLKSLFFCRNTVLVNYENTVSSVVVSNDTVLHIDVTQCHLTDL